ncbi:ATP-binding cassette domain-containing protein [Mycoplasma anserisalpingitidis]|uniref:ATP-binding cassette domain-containing protein n=1 Tax=Mycoplasma anserisalpingitidis TaxID=519450 RepID=UPI0030153B25
MIEVQNLSKIFSDKKLFENVNIKFLEGNTYGIIGANGAGKSTFLKILSGEIEASGGQIIIEKNRRISVLSQNHNAYDEMDVTEVVITGNNELYEIKERKDAIYNNPEATMEDYTLAGNWKKNLVNLEDELQKMMHKNCLQIFLFHLKNDM